MADPTRTSASSSRLDVSAELLSIEPGLYTVDLACAQRTQAGPTISFPFISLTAMPAPAGEPGRAYVSTLSDTQIIQVSGQTAYLRVAGGPARVLLTIYTARGATALPEVIIRQATTVSHQPPAVPSKEEDVPSLPLSLLAHIERLGDITVQGGRWAGAPGSKASLEGFAISPEAGLSPADIEYQAVLGIDWRTPWASDGAFCGSRGLSLPLLGIAVRLSARAAATHTVAYWGSFGGQLVGPVSDGEVCAGTGAPLEAIRVTINIRGEQPALPKPETAATLPEKPAPPRKRPKKP